MKPVHLVPVVTAMLLVVEPRAFAADDPRATSAEARRLKTQGDTYMDQYAYPDAYALYDRAHALSADPALVYNMARALQGMGDYPAALARLEEFDRVAPSSVKARVPALAELFQELRSHVATLVLRCPVIGARIIVRDRVVGTVGESPEIRVNAGSATVEVLADAFAPFKTSLELPGGHSTTLEVALVPRREVASLSVRVAPAGSLVTVDHVALGLAPIETQLVAGRHELVITRDGYGSRTVPLRLAAGEERKVDVALDRRLTSQWWFWTGAGVLLAAGTILTVALLSERSPGEGSFSPGLVRSPLTF